MRKLFVFALSLIALCAAQTTKQYVADFPTALEVNQTLSFHGTFTDQTTGVIVFRLQTTENYETPETIALELTIDFGLKKFIRNSFVDGKWGVKDTTGPFPFTDGDLFSFSLYVTETGFSITADGESVWTYAHRAPLDSVKHFVTKGSVDLEDVTVFQTFEAPTETDTENTVPVVTPDYPVLPVTNPTLPFFGTLWKEWIVTESYVIKGTVNTVATENFEISFFGDKQLEDNIAFRLSVHWTENKIYRQSLVAGQWRTEETDGGFPLAVGKPFEIVIVADYDHFNVLINGEHFCTYTYTYELSRITNVHITGPVTIVTLTPGTVITAPTVPTTQSTPVGHPTTTVKPTTTTIPTTPTKPTPLPRMCDTPYRQTLPVFNPTVPFLARIPYVEDHELGQRVFVNGRFNTNVPDTDKHWVEIRLQPCPTGAKNDNIAVTVSVRFNKKLIRTFDYVDKKWTQNVNQSNGFPVAKGQKFTVTFISDVGAYRINVNNKHFVNHPYHNPKPRARFVRVYGPVKLTSVTYDRNANLQLKKKN